MTDKIKILAHRGFWTSQIERNSENAIKNALAKGFGFESDIRDYCCKLVISHDIATEQSFDAAKIFELLATYNDEFCFAINIKSDGLKDLLLQLIEKFNIKNYFAFDMSVPQMIEYADAGLTFFTRQSEVEKNPVMYEKASGIWIDGFFGDDWITEKLLQAHLDCGKKICLVSPELHKREYVDFWKKISTFDLKWENVMLCTDKPDEAKDFFCGMEASK